MFQEFLEKHNIKDKKIAVGVSGGADSLATLLMAAEELSPKGYQIIALTVDHGLRPCSHDEADYVKKTAQKFGIEHHTLLWQGQKPKTGIEEAARSARYALIEDWCKKNDVHYLMTAHHLYDQAETFLMRLYRGSGLDGLCGMKEVSTYGKIFILRPFLQTNPQVMKDYLQKKNIRWIEDESNNDESLLRVKIRHFLPELAEKTGIFPLKIAQTMEKLQISRQYFENKVQNLIDNNFKCFSKCVYVCSYDFFVHQDDEIRYRLTAFLLKQTGNLSYPPEAEKTLRLIEKINSDTFKSATLGHCRIVRLKNNLWFCREIKAPAATQKKDWRAYLDAHPNLKKKHLPAAARQALLAD